MPGVASIKLFYVPIGNYDYEQLETLQNDFDTIFTRELQRRWEAYVFTDNLAWEEVVGRLDKVLIATAIGGHAKGDVIPDSSPAVNPDPSPGPPAPPRWVPELHSGTVKLSLKDKQPFTFKDRSKELQAQIFGEYSLKPGKVLKK